MLADEMNLFPGVVTVLLALIGVFGSKSRSRYPYVVGLIFAIVMTAGANGVLWVALRICAAVSGAAIAGPV